MKAVSPTAYSPCPPSPVNPGMFDSPTHMGFTLAVWMPLVILATLLLPLVIVACFVAMFIRWVGDTI